MNFTHSAKLKTVLLHTGEASWEDVRLVETQEGYMLPQRNWYSEEAGVYTKDGERLDPLGNVSHDICGRDYTLHDISPLPSEIEVVRCECCGLDLTYIEEENRYKSSEGEFLCESCYYEEECTECGRCGELVGNADVSNEYIYIGEEDEDELGVKAGYYKTDGTFFATDGFSLTLYKDSIEFVAAPDGVADRSAIGLCSECRRELSEKTALATV